MGETVERPQQPFPIGALVELVLQQTGLIVDFGPVPSLRLVAWVHKETGRISEGMLPVRSLRLIANPSFPPLRR